MSIAEYLEGCRADPGMYASAPERILKAIGEPQVVDTAKDQRLSTLNPSQISGTCGRLMCCLRHEHEFYVHARKRFPKEGKILTTALGDEKVVSNDIFRDQVTLHSPEGESRTIPLAQLRKELGDGALSLDEPEWTEKPTDAHEFVSLRRSKTIETPSSAPAGGGEPDDEPDDEDALGTAAAAADATADAPTDATADAPHQGRRRRGRRGGRRGRGPDAPPAPPV